MKEKIKKYRSVIVFVLVAGILAGLNIYTYGQWKNEEKNRAQLSEQVEKLAGFNEELSRENQKYVYENDVLGADKTSLETSLSEVLDQNSAEPEETINPEDAEMMNAQIEEYSSQVETLKSRIGQLEEQLELAQGQLTERDYLITELKKETSLFENGASTTVELETEPDYQENVDN